ALARHQATRAGTTTADARADPVIPRQVPAPVRHFVARAAELATLWDLADQAIGTGGGAAVVSAISGPAGGGETALALEFAHRAAARFPDGQLYVNLRGFDPSGTPVRPAEAIRGLLDAFHVPASRVPAPIDAQAALFRSLMAGRRMLLV